MRLAAVLWFACLLCNERVAASPPSAAGSSKARSAASAKVTVPSTDHVHVDVPSGLQAWLDADDRMRPWLGKAIRAVDACYAEARANDPNATGVAVFTVTMHPNERPSARVSSIPGPLRGMVLCVTARLMQVKMPLFTGDEGQTYTVSVRLTP